ncbi:MAG: A/G-specific adenine glycosylase [Acidobacteriota bacterium]
MGRPKSELRNEMRLRTQLLSWYDAQRRDLPWRRTSDPYAIWVSEIMLQQTRVAVVIDRFTAFLERFPTIDALARAQEDDVLALWSGLGYYRRARMLHKAARLVAEQLDGRLPETAKELRDLPGIGSYTAAAIASIAHGERVAVVDGNVERVLCRLAGWEFNGDEGAGALRKKVEHLATSLVDPRRPGDFNQAMMELGATVCLPRNPQCQGCPIVAHCATRGEHATPPRPRMRNREVSYALATRVRNSRGGDWREVLLERRSASETVMPGMWELPAANNAGEQPQISLRHAIMQVNYTVRVHTLAEKDAGALVAPPSSRRWIALQDLPSLPLTGLARKVLIRAHLLPAESRRSPRSTSI